VPAVVALTLFPGVSRAETRVEHLVLPPSAQIAQIAIQLEARDDYPRYRAELRTRRGEDVLTQGNLTRRRTGTGYAVAFDVPTSALASGEYELSLKGIAGDGAVVDIGYYYFSVRKP
jgi:methionine-rich copper-binding protein CopC